MPWRPLPSIAFAIAIHAFQPTTPADLPLELGDELYIIEQGGSYGDWYRGYLVTPPSTLSGLAAAPGKALESRVFSGIFPRNCVEIREVLGDSENARNSISLQQLPDLGLTEAHVSTNDIIDQIDKARVTSQVTVIKLDDDDNSRRSSSRISTMRPISTIIPLPLKSSTSNPANDADESPSKPPAPVPMLKIGDETPTSLSEPLVDEIASCLREWHSTNFHELLLSRNYSTIESIRGIVAQLNMARRQLLHDVLTSREREVLREQTVWKLVQGNKMLSGEVIVRDPEKGGRLLTGDDSAIRLASLQSEMGMLEGPTIQKEETSASRHLLCELSAMAGSPTTTTIAASLILRTSGGEYVNLSETFQMSLSASGNLSTVIKSITAKTLFTDIATADLAEGTTVFLVVKLLVSESATQRTPTPSSADSGSGKAMKSASVTTKGRRSVMWNGKPRGHDSHHKVQQSADFSNSRSKLDFLQAKETIVTRAVGVGALDVSSALRHQSNIDDAIEFYCPVKNSQDTVAEAFNGFEDLIHPILPSAKGRYKKSGQLIQLKVHISPLIADDVDALVQENPLSLHQVVQTRRVGFAVAPTKPRSDIYLLLSKANIAPDALFSHPLHGQVPAPTGVLRYLQLTLEVRNADGDRIEHCIYPSSDDLGHTAWRTNVTDRGTPWEQLVRINIPADEVAGSHIIMSLANAPDFPCALCWMPLWTEKTFIQDGPHSLLLHAYDRATSNVEDGKGAYLSQPWSSLGKNDSAKDENVTGPMATISVRTELCSTEYTQDRVLFDLINWKDHSKTDVHEFLDKIVLVPEIEIVKQMRGVLDALFGIMVEHADNDEIEDLVFQNLITVLGIVHDRRFNLTPLVDRYVEIQFYFPFATPGLVRSFSRLLQASADSSQHRTLRAAFKVAQHILKFVTKAREQQQIKEEEIGVTGVRSTFNRDLHFIFRSIERLIQNPNPVLVGSKTLVVQRFHTWLPELVNALPQEEITHIALSFMDACEDVKGMLILYKLVLIMNYVSMPIFSGPKAQKMLQTNVCKWIDPYWGSVPEVTDLYCDQVRLCCSIVASFLQHPNSSMSSFLPKAVASYAAIATDEVQDTEYLSLLFSKSFPFQLKQSKTTQRVDEALIELSVIIGAISEIPRLRVLDLPHDALDVFVNQALDCHNSVLNCEAYPKAWLSLHIYQHRTTIDSLGYLSTILTQFFIPSPDDAETFNTQLWKLFFQTLMNVISSESLALEAFPEQKRRVVWKVAGDVREHGAELLRKTWDAIGWDAVGNEREQYGLERFGGYQVQYVPSLIFPIVKICISVHQKLRNVAVELLWSLIASEWQLNEDLGMIEAEIIASLDTLFKSRTLSGSSISNSFVAELFDIFERAGLHNEPRFSTAMRNLLATVDELLELLSTTYTGDVAESMNTLRLMEFMKDVEKEDIFVRYVHDLAYSHAAAGNHAEAGLALKFHADLYDWEVSRIVPALQNPNFPVQTSFERKEYLFCKMIRHFEEGKAWTQALSCYKELSDYYENVVTDYSKLSKANLAIGKIYGSIVKNDKRYPRYFRVIFKGLGFPEHLRDKQYIVEGSPSEKMINFTDRMQKEYPAAKIVSAGDVNDYEGQYLHISSVSVHRNLSHPSYQRPKVPMSVREHLLTSEPSEFSVVSRRYTSGNNYKEHWVTKTIFLTAEPFPNILRRSEIVETSEITLNALDTAIERTWRKTQELLTLYKRAMSGSETGMHALTDTLRQLLDAGSSATTSVAIYHGFLSNSQSGSFDNESDDLKDIFETIFVEELAAMTSLDPPIEQDYDESAVEMEKPEIGIANVVSAIPGRFAQVNGSTSGLSRTGSTSHSQASALIPKNVFRRADHKPSGSTATITRDASESSKRNNLDVRTESQMDQHKGNDNSLSRTPSRDARSVKRHRSRLSTFGSARRGSWFSTNGTNEQAVQDAKTKLSISTPATSTEDVRITQQRITERATRSAMVKKAARNGTPSIRSFDSRKEYIPSTPFSGGSEFSASSRGTEHFMSLNENSEMPPVVSLRHENDPKTSLSKKGSVRGSVMRRFSLLKVGKKTNRINMKESSVDLTLKEE
ncbi:hypothetical protein KEM56_006930 [Ascosphaera pollenicola]|nr:hypothetical protein KEM56_006930 [Ascosphaera pollenicola]